MKTITMATLKGGAGKTMNCFNIAGVVAENKKVLLIDMDPQCNLSSNCGIDISESDKIYTITEVFDNSPKNQPSPKELITKNPIPELKNLDIIPSNIMLFKTERNISLKADRERMLEKYINKYKEEFEAYDYIFIDTNPSLSYTNVNAFLIADEIILSCDVSNNSITGAELFCALWDEMREELSKDDNISALLISNFDGRSNLAKDLKDYTKSEEFSRDIILETIISSTVKLKATEIEHKPINILSPKHQACTQYRNLVKELKKRSILWVALKDKAAKTSLQKQK